MGPMGHVVNHYSFMIIGIFVLFVIVLVSWRFLGIKSSVVIIGFASVLLITTQLSFRTYSNTHPSIEAFDNALSADRPVLLELYSNF